MPRVSQPAALAPFRNRTGSTSYRVTASIRGKQRKKCFRDLAEAEETQRLWEIERTNEVSMRLAMTRLTSAEIREAEAATELLKAEGLSLLDVARYRVAHPPQTYPAITFGDGLREFLVEKKHLSVAQSDSYRQHGENFKAYIGDDRLISDITPDDVLRWLRAKGSLTAPLGKKTWNNYRNDLSAIFVWFQKKPRRWLKENPVEGIIKFPKRSLGHHARQRLEPETCRELMHYLERERSNWCTFFVLTLFLGVRPDMHNGEIWELARCVARDGAGLYFQEGYLHLSAEITKEGEPRQTAIPANAVEWLKRYPPTAASICPGDYDAYREIRNRFGIPRDGLRRTMISAYVAKGGSLANAAIEFGCSEAVIRTHYFARMGLSAAEAFYRVLPVGCPA